MYRIGANRPETELGDYTEPNDYSDTARRRFSENDSDSALEIESIYIFDRTTRLNLVEALQRAVVNTVDPPV